MSRRLELLFKNEDGGNVTLLVEDPQEPVDPEQVKNAMDTVIESDVFYSPGGMLKEVHGARIVERTVEPVEFE
ncbi:DUF2922 domain-containing protein [Alteribacter natronophilus]|uniref:DUF2922 domain-containing protein n=1 Tax=Alteribacter natronophilus TaxID=2583810 RepID=UPI00110EFD28|nr:DUF2922 domain-containing protein [Alteribacter natronophilus]TMW71529.1 DUF2922 domain-containing protein [Alteribacter natronophilus]